MRAHHTGSSPRAGGDPPTDVVPNRAGGSATAQPPAGRSYAWVVLALSCGLMLSDHMARNVISAILPHLKIEWALSDGQLGLLVGIVSVVVGVASLPVSLLADRWGRVRSVTAMAGLWCVATIACGLSQNHAQMLIARGFLGLGEAGYGSVGGAILAHVFPGRRSLVMGAFLAAAILGAVIGVALGGAIAARHGWRWAPLAIGTASLVLVVAYPLVVRDYSTVAIAPPAGGARLARTARLLRELFAGRTAVLVCLGSGLGMILLGVLNAWMPTYLLRHHGISPEKAAALAGTMVLASGVGMILGGWLADRLGRHDARNRLVLPALYSIGACVLLATAFLLHEGYAQFALFFGGACLAGGPAGVAGAVITDVTHPGLRATALAVLVLANNLLGLAPGPMLAGALSDVVGLRAALACMPLAGLAAATFYLMGARHYAGERGRHAEPEDQQSGLSPRCAG